MVMTVPRRHKDEAKPRQKHHRPTREEMDERVNLPDDPEKVIEAVLKVDPESEPTDQLRQPGNSDEC